MKNCLKIGIAVFLLSIPLISRALILTHFYETKNVSGTQEFMQALDDAVKTNALYEYGRYHCTFRLQPGVYDVSALEMHASYHIYLPAFYEGAILGLGEKPEDVVLVGGGEAKSKGVMFVSSGNYQSFVVSNLTVTGGYCPSYGGGIAGGESQLTKVIDCIVTNNYAVLQGGGLWRLQAERCLIKDNRAGSWGGGASSASTTDCFVISNHQTVATGGNGGGGGTAWGNHTRCLFLGNTSTAQGGGAAVPRYVVDSVFDSNFGVMNGASYGGHAWRGAYTNCVFRGYDAAKGSSSCIGGVAYCAKLVGCVISNNVAGHYMIANSLLDRCLFADNTTTVDAALITDYVNADRTLSDCRAINSVFKGNTGKAGTAATVLSSYTCVNCTFIDNVFAASSRFGALGYRGARINCLAVGNTPYDYSAENGLVPAMTNTLWTTDWRTVASEAVVGSGKVAGLEFDARIADAPLTPRKRSPACNAGFMDDAVAAAVGTIDFYGRPRVTGTIDIGAAERQPGDDTGLNVIVR